MKKIDQNLTQGPIIRTLLLFAMPMMAGNMLQQLYNITDTMIVSTLCNIVLDLLFVSVCIWFVAEKLMTVFVSPEKTAVIAEGVRYLHIEGATYVGIGILFLWYAYYRGIQKPHISLILTIVSLGTRVALSYSLAPYHKAGVLIIWWSITIGWFLADLVGFGIYRRLRKGAVAKAASNVPKKC